jgi:hypothetical protein
MKEALIFSESSVLTRATWRNIPEDGILHSHRRETHKSYIALTGWTLYWSRNVSPVRYELGSYIPEDAILHSHRRENLKSYMYLCIHFPYAFMAHCLITSRQAQVQPCLKFLLPELSIIEVFRNKLYRA